MTLSIPKDLYNIMKKHTHIKWSDVARKAFEKQIKYLDMIDILKDFDDAEKDFKAGKGIPLEQVIKELKDHKHSNDKDRYNTSK